MPPAGTQGGGGGRGKAKSARRGRHVRTLLVHRRPALTNVPVPPMRPLSPLQDLEASMRGYLASKGVDGEFIEDFCHYVHDKEYADYLSLLESMYTFTKE